MEKEVLKEKVARVHELLERGDVEEMMAANPDQFETWVEYLRDQKLMIESQVEQIETLNRQVEYAGERRAYFEKRMYEEMGKADNLKKIIKQMASVLA